MNGYDLVSVVVPVYNRASTIGDCLKSVRAQTYENWEAVVVDDASSDRTAEVVSELATEDRRIRLFRHNRNRGAQAARNSGIRSAKGEWIAFLDSDDQFLPCSLSVRLERANKEGVFVVHSDCNVIRENGLIEPYRARPLTGWIYSQLLAGEGPVFPGLLVLKHALEKIDYLDEQIVAFQEWETAIRLSRRFPFAFEAEPTFIWDCRNADTISKQLNRGGRGYEQVLQKHFAAVLWHGGPRALARHYRIAASWYHEGGDLRAEKRCRRNARIWSSFDPRRTLKKISGIFARRAE